MNPVGFEKAILFQLLPELRQGRTQGSVRHVNQSGIRFGRREWRKIPTSAPPNTHANTTALMVMGLMIEFCTLPISGALCAR